MPDYFACSRFMFKKRHFCGQFYVTFITVLIFLHDVSAQDAAIDSLKKILRQLRDTARVGYLNRISGAYTKFIMCGAVTNNWTQLVPMHCLPGRRDSL